MRKYEVNLKKTFSVEVEVNITFANISIGNNGIGWYEYGSERTYDRGQDYVEDYEITKITFSNKEEVPAELREKIENMLAEDENLDEEILEKLKEGQYE